MSRDLRNNIKGSLERQEILSDLTFFFQEKSRGGGVQFSLKTFFSQQILAVLKTWLTINYSWQIICNYFDCFLANLIMVTVTIIVWLKFLFWQPLLFRLSEVKQCRNLKNCTILGYRWKLKKVQPWNFPPFCLLRDHRNIILTHCRLVSKSNQEYCYNGWLG